MVSEMGSVNNDIVENAAYATNVQPTIDPKSIGIEFVRQYYTMLNKAPHLLFRFYSDDSTFVHGEIDANGRPQSLPVRGQKQINAKIMSLQFKNCRTKIRQVDSMETIGHGVVVQVIGELSIDSQPLRRFLQTFVLTPQSPNKYYVRNDIFRYSDNPNEYEEAGNDNDDEEEIASAEADEVAEMANSPEYEQPQQQAKPAPVVAESQPPEPEEEIAHQANGSIDETGPATEAPHELEKEASSPDNEQSAQQSSIGQQDAEATPAVNQSPSAENVASSKASPPQASEPKTYASMVGRKFPNNNAGNKNNAKAVNKKMTNELEDKIKHVDKVANDTNSPNVQVPNHSENADPITSPTTNKREFVSQREYRFLKKGAAFGNNGNAASSNHSSAAQPGAPAPPAAAAAAAAGAGHNIKRNDLKESAPMKTITPTTNDSDEGDNFRKFPDEHQLFIGNLLANVTEEELQAVFERFGKIVDIRIHRQLYKSNGKGIGRNYGFITFDNSEVVEHIMTQKPIYFDNHRYNVERKQGRFGYNNRGNNNGNAGASTNQMGGGGGGGGPAGGGNMRATVPVASNAAGPASRHNQPPVGPMNSSGGGGGPRNRINNPNFNNSNSGGGGNRQHFNNPAGHAYGGRNSLNQQQQQQQPPPPAQR